MAGPEFKPQRVSSAERDALVSTLQEWLRYDKEERNTVRYEDFKMYLPLFNKEAYEKLSPAYQKELSNHYYTHFSQRDPIFIVSDEIDEEHGAVLSKDHKKHKIVLTIPARFNQLETINKLGKKASELELCMLNGMQSTSPFDTRGERYAAQFTHVFTKVANKEDDLHRRQDEFAQQEKKFLQDINGTSNRSSGASSDSNPSGIDADWD